MRTKIPMILVLILSAFLVAYGLGGIVIVDGPLILRIIYGNMFAFAGAIFGALAWHELKKDGE